MPMSVAHPNTTLRLASAEPNQSRGVCACKERVIISYKSSVMVRKNPQFLGMGKAHGSKTAESKSFIQVIESNNESQEYLSGVNVCRVNRLGAVSGGGAG
jgi:hypothetical protein